MKSKNPSLKSIFFNIIPGISVCILIAIISKIIGRFIPSMGAATISIFLGIIVGNTIGKQDILKNGTKFAEGTLLSISVVLLGATLSIQTLLDLGINGLIFILLQMLVTIIGVITIGRKMKFDTDFILLMASGNSVCGSSAIASTSPVIHAHSRDKGISITMVNVTGTILMVVLPFITALIYGNELNRTSAMLGGILQSVGQVVAAGSMISNEVKDLATLYKIVRIIFLVGVVFLLAAIKRKSAKQGIELVEKEIHNNTHQSRVKVPWYIVGFFITCGLFSVGIIPENWGNLLKNIDNFIEIISLAGIGMRVYIKDLLQQGIKVSLYCIFISIVQIISSITLIGIFL